MDPLTQGVLGAAVSACGCGQLQASQSSLKNKSVRLAVMAGFLGGILADADVFIKSASDPLFSLLMHRHFTHSLIFIPVGGFIASLFIWLLLMRKVSFKEIFFYSTLGYATHGLLDAITSYGTLLFWPFSNKRISYDLMPIIEPVYTLILLVGVCISFYQNKKNAAVYALFFSFIVMAFAFWQHTSSLKLQHQLALKRGHLMERSRVMPTIGNYFVWRSVYESDGKIYFDTIRNVPLKSKTFWEGNSLEKFRIDSVKISDQSNLFRNIKFYQWFSDDYLAFVPEYPDVLGDFRYSLNPAKLLPIWGLEINLQNPEQFAKTRHFRNIHKPDFRQFLKAVMGSSETLDGVSSQKL